jgi:hypothetical protein
MDKVRLILTLISIAITVGPIAVMLIAYQDNLGGLFIPPEVNEIADNLVSGGGGVLGAPTQLNSTYDASSRTVTLTFQFKNPFNFPITVNSMSGGIVCDKHNFPLGNATLKKPASVGAGETATMTVLGTWTEEAIDHFQAAHAGEKKLTVGLVNLAVDVSGIKIQTNERMQIPDVPIA